MSENSSYEAHLRKMDLYHRKGDFSRKLNLYFGPFVCTAITRYMGIQLPEDARNILNTNPESIRSGLANYGIHPKMIQIVMRKLGRIETLDPERDVVCENGLMNRVKK